MKCSSCDNDAVGTFFVMYHHFEYVVQAEVSCTACAQEWEGIWDKPPKRMTGFVPDEFIDDVDKMYEYLIQKGILLFPD